APRPGRVVTPTRSSGARPPPPEPAAKTQIRVRGHKNSNPVSAQPAPADLEEIRNLITWTDVNESRALNDLRVIKLSNSLADELGTILIQAISQGVVAPSTTAPGVFPGGGGFGGGIPGGGGFGGGAPGGGGLCGAGVGACG